ncbi:hypothetical protein [uncultured Roseobacter sp.]|uniref:hypothetical protein n=1 Tax=uncultured Roseobacter sp. TaxID=114847 RepID=UPI00263626CE|nr:hypothetical protein [uncultured Roseobacter sp.]
MRVLLHFGFPKAMSSTLQFGLFQPLHEQGLVNLKTWRLNDPAEHLDLRPSSRLFNRQDILPHSLEFKEGMLNILSDESFTAPYKLRRNNYGDDIEDPSNFPRAVKEQIEAVYGEGIEFIPLIVIRNQADLIFSQYVEEYNLKKYKNVDLLFDEAGNIDPSGFEIYRFYTYIQILENVFGAGVPRVFLFEEWRSDLSAASKAMADLLGADLEGVRQNLEGSHFNKKKKSAEGYFAKDEKTFIPNLNSEQKNEILEAFDEDNRKLQAYLGTGYDLSSLGYFGFR